MNASIIDEIASIAKTVLPWLTGGLGGAILGFFLNRRINKKREARLNIATKLTEFSITGNAPLREKLSVSYDKQQYNNLFVAECVIENLSGRTILEAKIVLGFDTAATHVTGPIVDSIPVPAACSFSKVDSSSFSKVDSLSMLQCFIERIERSARIRLQFLVNGSPKFRVVLVAAKDDPEIIQAGTGGGDVEPDVLIRAWVAYAAMYTLVGAIPLLGEIMRGVLIMTAFPLLQRTSIYYRRRQLQPNSDIAINIGQIQAKEAVVTGHEGK